MNRDSFIFYRSFYESIRNLPDKQISKLFIAICEYALNHNEANLDDKSKSLFILIKPQLEANYKKWLNGCKGGVPKGTINNPKGNNQYNKEDNLKDNQRIIKGKRNENVNDNVNDNVNANEKEIVMLHQNDVALYKLPLNKNNTFKYIYDIDIKYYEDLYPNVDVKQEFRNMIGWLNSNPTKKKTKSGIDRFINNWLSKKQNAPSGYTNNKSDNKFSVENMMRLVNESGVNK